MLLRVRKNYKKTITKTYAGLALIIIIEIMHHSQTFYPTPKPLP